MIPAHAKTDSEIQQDVLRELAWDTRVDETEVGVQVHHGIVTLTGTEGSYAKKLAAAESAHRVRGVRDVANDINVKMPGIGALTDTEVAEAVRSALRWDALIPSGHITTTVTGGWVTLSGEVDRWAQREEAERAIRRLRGVVGIANHIAVKPAQMEPALVRRAIEEALARRALREAGHLTVTVEEGVATVAGSVHSWPEKQAVLGAAGHAPGIHAVHDNLRIDPLA